MHEAIVNRVLGIQVEKSAGCSNVTPPSIQTTMKQDIQIFLCTQKVFYNFCGEVTFIIQVVIITTSNTPLNISTPIINTQCPNIKFTLEQAKSTISFLDVEIKINWDKFDSWTWRKPSNNELLLNVNAFCPKIWKKVLFFVFSIEQKLSVQRTDSSKKKSLI